MHDAPAEVAALSWLVELPRDLGLKENVHMTRANSETVIPGWDNTQFIPGRVQTQETTVVPLQRLRFRRAHLRTGLPNEAAERAFGSELRQFKNSRASKKHHRRVERDVERGVKEWKTVCQLTRWYWGDEVPDPPESRWDPGRDSIYRQHFNELLDELDLWLQAYGLISGELDIGSIALHDLPSEVPWIIQLQGGPYADTHVFDGMLPIHGKRPELISAEGNPDAAKGAMKLVYDGPQAYPFFNGFSLVFQAQAHALAGRGRQSVMDMGTGVEALVSEVVRGALTLRGGTEAGVNKLLSDTKWRDVFNDELPKALGVPKGQNEPQHAKWWRDCYPLRTKTVHRGYRPVQDEALTAVDATWDLFDWIGNKAREQPDLKAMGKSIRVHRK
ncbi:MAG: hypothetical protein WBQ41_16540 [Solirubrobacterales bacterium]